MTAAVRLTLYAAALAVVFGAAFGLGHLVRSDEPRVKAGDVPGGLQVTRTGYTLRPGAATLPDDGELGFTILGPDGTIQTRFTPLQGAELHLFWLRRDLRGYRHLHPERAADGTFTAHVTDPEAGSHRVFAVFRPPGAERPVTLGADVNVGGDFDPEELPVSSRLAEIDGFEVSVSGWLRVGRDSRLTFTITRDGKPVGDLERPPHLVVVRSGDLALLQATPAGGGTGPDVSFTLPAVTDGDYRVFLDFVHEGSVRTAGFTMTAHRDL